MLVNNSSKNKMQGRRKILKAGWALKLWSFKKLTLCLTNSWKSWTIWIWRRFWRSWYCHQFFCPQQRSTVRSQQHWQILFSWQRRLYQIFATWSWRTGKCQNCQRSSSSHVFTNPESTNLRFFFKFYSIFLFFCKVEVFFWKQKCW